MNGFGARVRWEPAAVIGAFVAGALIDRWTGWGWAVIALPGAVGAYLVWRAMRRRR